MPFDRSHARRRLATVAGTIAIALLATGCDATSAPSADAPSESTTASTTDTATPASDSSANPALDAMYAAIDGLEGEDRTAKLVELAADEDGLDLYGGANIKDMLPVLEAFEDKFDIEPNYYRASSSDLMRRILQESEANYVGNDLVQTDAAGLVHLDSQGLLARLQTPATADIIPAGVADNWAAMFVSTYIAAWNTNTVTTPPTTWEEVLTEFDGSLALELGDWIWFATLTTQYFTKEKGMSEAEVVEMMKAAARRATVLDGHTLMAELVVAGEYDLGASLYHHRVAQFKDDGAPIAWEAPITPLIMRPGGIGIMQHARNPATAMLFAEFLLTDAQQIFAEAYRGPASSAVNGGIPAEYGPIMIDLEALVEDREKWEGLWEEIVAEGGQPVSD